MAFEKCHESSLARKVGTKSVLGVILEQRSAPGGPFALAVNGVRVGSKRSTPHGGAARSVSNDHTVTEQLGGQLHVGCLTTPTASTGELQQRLLELRS